MLHSLETSKLLHFSSPALVETRIEGMEMHLRNMRMLPSSVTSNHDFSSSHHDRRLEEDIMTKEPELMLEWSTDAI